MLMSSMVMSQDSKTLLELMLAERTVWIMQLLTTRKQNSINVKPHANRNLLNNTLGGLKIARCRNIYMEILME